MINKHWFVTKHLVFIAIVTNLAITSVILGFTPASKFFTYSEE